MQKGDIFLKRDGTSLRIFEYRNDSLIHTLIDDNTLSMYEIPEYDILERIRYGDYLQL